VTTLVLLARALAPSSWRFPPAGSAFSAWRPGPSLSTDGVTAKPAHDSTVAARSPPSHSASLSGRQLGGVDTLLRASRTLHEILTIAVFALWEAVFIFAHSRSRVTRRHWLGQPLRPFAYSLDLFGWVSSS